MTLSNMVLFLIFKSSPPYVSEPYNTFETFYIYQLIQKCCDVHALLVKMPGVNVSVNNGGGGLVKPGTTTNTCLMCDYQLKIGNSESVDITAGMECLSAYASDWRLRGNVYNKEYLPGLASDVFVKVFGENDRISEVVQVM